MVAEDVTHYSPIACLQALVGKEVKAKAGSIVGCGLLGVSDPEHNMVSVYQICTETKDFSEGGSGRLVLHA